MGEDAKEKGTRKVGGAGKRFRPFYFRVFSIQRTRLSRSLEQARRKDTIVLASKTHASAMFGG